MAVFHYSDVCNAIARLHDGKSYGYSDRLLMTRKLPSVIFRVLLFLYTHKETLKSREWKSRE